MAKPSLEPLLTAIKNAEYLVKEARMTVDLEPDELTSTELTEARNQLTDASNAINDAMGEIDKLLAPEPTVWGDPHLP